MGEPLTRQELDAKDRRERRIVEWVADADGSTREPLRAAIHLTDQPTARPIEKHSLPLGPATLWQQGAGDRLGWKHLRHSPLDQKGAGFPFLDLDLDGRDLVSQAGPRRDQREREKRRTEK